MLSDYIIKISRTRAVGSAYNRPKTSYWAGLLYSFRPPVFRIKVQCELNNENTAVKKKIDLLLRERHWNNWACVGVEVVSVLRLYINDKIHLWWLPKAAEHLIHTHTHTQCASVCHTPFWKASKSETNCSFIPLINDHTFIRINS